MKIGLTYDLKEDVSAHRGQLVQAAPDDILEEYDSLETLQGLCSAIESRGHSVVRLGGGRPFLERVVHRDVDLVFNISEGLGNYRSREAQVPAVLEMLDIPYSGADPQCLAVCLDKPLTKKIVSLAGIPTPEWRVVDSQASLSEMDWEKFPFPAFVKPAYEGSSKGVRLRSRVETPDQLFDVVASVLSGYRQPVMVERFVAGEEITVGLVGNSPPVLVGIMRVVPKQKTANFVYSLEVKRDWENLVEYECPARLPETVLQQITDHSLLAFDVLGCRDFGRVDFRVGTDGRAYFLEINPLAGLNPKSSDLPIMARKMGWTYEALIEAVLDAALERYPGCSKK
ncbi:MAG: D-alanine--D-alanine ligase [Dehalococcoidia bacterium]|nr:D-alanine--D-alanine ligase [Dehalococcoidia bacterium]